MGAIIRGFALLVIGGLLAFGILYFARPGGIGIAGLGADAGVDAPVAPVEIPEGNGIGLQARDWGIARCLGGITSLSQFLTNGTTSNWLLTRGSNNADRELFAATIIAKEESTGLRGVSNIYAAPVRNGGCNTAYESTVYFAMTCAQARQQVFASFSNPIALGSDVAEAYSTAEGAGRLFLMPIGENGCVAVKSEIFY